MEGCFHVAEGFHHTAVLGLKLRGGLSARKGQRTRGTAVIVQFARLFPVVHQDMLAHADVDITPDHDRCLFGIKLLSRCVVEDVGNP